MSRGTRLRRSVRSLIIAIAAIALLAGPARADVDVTGDDTQAPVIDNYMFAPTRVDVSAAATTVTVTFHGTDDVSGIEGGWIWLYGPGNARISGYASAPASGTRLDGTWTVDYTIPAQAASGLYRVGYCEIWDKVRHLVQSCSSTNGVEVVGGTDTAPPSLTEYAFSPSAVHVADTGESVDLIFRGTDDVTGVSGGWIWLYGPGNVRLPGYATAPETGDRTDGMWRVPFTIPGHAPAGTYRVQYCEVRDGVGHLIQNCYSASTLEVTSSEPDTELPTLTDYTFTPSQVDVTSSAATVVMRFRGLDDVAGIAGGWIWLYGPGNVRIPGYASAPTDGDRRDGRWDVTYQFAAHAPTGTYRVGYCEIWDNVRHLIQNCQSGGLQVVDRSVDLATALTASTSSLTTGAIFTLTAKVTNNGPATPVEPRLSVPVPQGTTLMSVPSGCSPTNGGPVVCEIERTSLEPGESMIRAVELKVSADASGPVAASATASSESAENTPENNTANLSIPLTTTELPDDPTPGSKAKLSLSNTVSPLEALPGDTVTYTLTATNGTGAGDATGTVVTDVLPDGVTFADASEGCTDANGTVRCEFGTIPAGESRSATIRAAVDPIPMKADPNTAHQVLEQKAETDLRVERGETKTATASCPTGYVATDGGIRLDAVDQGGDVSRTSVPASGPTADGSGWTATLRNDNPGAALAKVTVACLAKSTVTGEHQHDLVTTTATAPAQPLAAGASTVVVACPTGQTPFAPSYALSGAGTVTTSEATGSSWTFVVDSPAAGTGDFAVACLGARTTTAAGHYHVLGIDHRSETVTVPAGQTVEAQLTCADEAKGIVASRRINAGLVDRGTDPRAKIRAFRLTNPTDHALTADLGLTCVDIRTSGEPVSVRIANTAAVSTTAADATTADDRATSTVTAYGDGWAILPPLAASVSGSARTASVGVAVRCATDCVVSARLVALGRVRGTTLRAGSTLGTGRATLEAGDGRLTLRATGTAAAALTGRRITRAKVVVTTTDGATTTRTITLRR